MGQIFAILVVLCFTFCIYSLAEIRVRKSIEHVQKLKSYRRKHIIQRNHAHAAYLNSLSKMNESSAKYGLTAFSKLTGQEFSNRFLCSRKGKKATGKSTDGLSATTSQKHNSLLPPKRYVDWRLQGAVTSVKNQRLCGGCWAFSVVETLESMNILKNDDSDELSVQQVINCAYDEGKCHGGDIVHTAKWLFQTKTNITTERKYPLTDTSGKCNIHYEHNEVLMLRLLENGPLSVSVDATLWQNYLGGIIEHHCGTTLNHAVQIVGYNLTGKVPYYIVRNSWGTLFGHQGYLYLKYGNNVCGIAQEVLSLRVV